MESLQASDVLINEAISNDGSGRWGRKVQRVLSVTNLSASGPRSLEILSTAAPARGNDSAYIPLLVTVPRRIAAAAR
jgi:hypothetical protein